MPVPARRTESAKQRDLKTALALVEEIDRMISEEIPESSLDRGRNFFESVHEKAKAIGESINKWQSASERQLDSLQNMRDGVAKWLHDD